ncbi:CHRD domain-containing protein [Lewinella sp. IMCC34183]|uniref:CHRD domain-containing protein n=1 Tax=Lewinella sp. IMCC34183 TaxID=2248762 RepID=UPI000E282AC7|nr:CHRD domain-containing protein [Lewinella sp. IMCC34183]
MRLQTFTHYLLVFPALFFATVLAAQVPASGVARLSGQQEVMPVVTEASGLVNVTFTDMPDDMIEVLVTGSFSDLSSPLATDINMGAHIHIGYPGQNGGIAVPLNPSLDADSRGGSFTAEDNTFMVADAVFSDAAPGQLYVNLHTVNYPGGEIRGAIVSNSTEQYYANLFGSNEVPSVLSRASGALVLELDEQDQLMVTGSFRNLSDTLATAINGGSHLHFGFPGANGPVNIPLKATLDADGRGGVYTMGNNTFELDDVQVDALRSGEYYANLHSGAHPSGEIRGQVLPPADMVFRAHLSGANEWPVVSTDASGQVLVHLDGNTIRVLGTFGDLSGPVATTIGGGAHLHPGYAGQNGAIAVSLLPRLTPDSLGGTFRLTDNRYTVTDAQKSAMLDRGLYLNIHTSPHPAGELRGQVLPESQAIFTAFLSGNQQIPSVITTGRGLVKVELRGETMTVTGSFQGLMSDLNTAISGGSHLHAGYPGQSGPVVYPLSATQENGDTAGVYRPMDNTFSIGGGGVDTLMRRFFYTNVHSMEYGGGEIRGSVLAEAESYYLAPLSGASEPRGVATMATGFLAVEVVDTNLTLVGSFSDLDSDFATAIQGGMHLHQAIAGRNGDIIQRIRTVVGDDNRSAVIPADSNRVALSMENFELMTKRRVYANVHSADNPSGAIRGQLLPLAGSYFHTTFSGVNATNYVMTTAEGGLKLELVDSVLTVTGAVVQLDGDYDESIQNGAHLHLAPAGQNGPIRIALNPDVILDRKGARFFAEENTFTLADSVVTALREGRLYANVHTTEVASGEARGQVRGELNLPPMPSAIASPASGASVTIEGDPNQAFVATYLPTTDPDGDTVIYVWQLSAMEDFTDILFASNTGRDTAFTTDFGTVETLLDGAGVDVGSSVTLYHRVLASDGSNYYPSAPASIVLERGDLTGVRDFRPDGFAARAYPNPARSNADVSYELSTRESFTGRLYLHNSLGQLVQDLPVNAQVGTQILPLRSASLSAGQYFLTLRHADGRLIDATRIVVQ